MPRARTKFIWPPPTDRPDDPKANSTEPPAKRQRVSASTGTPGSTRRRRTACNETSFQSHEPSSADDQGSRRPQSLQTTVSTGSITPPAGNPDSSIAATIKWYRDWRRSGSPHDAFCFICHESKDVLFCETCPRSYHEACVPSDEVTFCQPDRNRWYCAVCVGRNWHVNPPTITPPASPCLSPERAFQDISTTPSQRLGEVNTTANCAHNGYPAESAPRDPRGLSILADISRSLSREDKTEAKGSTCPLLASRNDYPLLSSAPMSSTFRRDERCETTPPSTAQYQSSSLLDCHARKSRFATLSNEVDSALWVLYRELESTTSLRQQIAELEAQIVKLRQEVSIRDNQLILSQRATKTGQIPQAELDRLRVQAAKADIATREAETLRTRNEVLEKELKAAKAETETMTGTLNEWKGKLINLIGN